MKYFGTNLNDYGHFTWDLTGPFMQKVGLLPNETPFNPEGLLVNLIRGETVYYQGGGFTAIAIAGSCKDERLGSKSVFWVRELISKEQMFSQIKQNEHARKIIDAMPFNVKWK